MTGQPHGLTRYKHGPAEDGTPGRGCTCAVCRQANTDWQANRSRMIAYGTWEGWHDAAGTQRRLQALMWHGWPLAWLARRLGCSKQVLRKKLLVSGKVTGPTAAAVRVLYAGVWDREPPARTKHEKRAVTVTRQMARERGWVPLAAWDEEPGPHYLEDPAATPAPGWERGERRQYGSLIEEAAELAGQGEHPEMIAARLGSSVKSVERTLIRVAERAA